MLDINNKDLRTSLISNADLALQSELGFLSSGNDDLDSAYRKAVIFSVMNELGIDLTNDERHFLVENVQGNFEYKYYWKNIVNTNIFKELLFTKINASLQSNLSVHVNNVEAMDITISVLNLNDHLLEGTYLKDKLIEKLGNETSSSELISLYKEMLDVILLTALHSNFDKKFFSEIKNKVNALRANEKGNN